MSTRDANALSPASPTSAPHLRFARTTSDPTVHRLNAEPAEEEREHEEERGRNGWLGDAGAAIGKRLSLRNGSKHQGSASEEVTRSTELAGASNTGAERGVPGEELEPERAGAAERVARHQAVEALSGGRSGRRRERESSEGGGSGARTPRRSTSLMGRKSMDANGDGMRSPRRSFSLIRRSMDAGPVDPLREPRRSIGKRPSEFELAARDPHHGVKDWWKHKRRAVPFAAPYANSGVVLDMPATLRDWIIPGPLTFGHGQWWYLVVAQSIVPALISGAINFGVAVALYLHQPSVTVWVFDRQTVAGDMGVTVIIQMIVQFVLVSALVHQDLAGGPIGPLRRPWPPLMHLPSTPSPEGNALGVKMPKDVLADGRPCPMGRAEDKGRWTRWWWWGVRAVLTGSERNDLLARGISWRQRLERFVWTAVQGFCLCALTFWWYW